MAGQRRFGRMLVRIGPFDRLHRLGQRPGEHFVDMADGHDLQLLLHGRRNFDQVLLIFRRDEHRGDATAQRREQLFLQAADRKHPAAQA